MKTVGNHILAFLGGFFSTLIVSIALVYLYLNLTFTRFTSSTSFSANVWKSPASIHDRFQMLDDLQHDYLGIGMKDDEVLLLLGVPDEIKSDSVWCYKVGSSGILAVNQKLQFTISKNIITDFTVE